MMMMMSLTNRSQNGICISELNDVIIINYGENGGKFVENLYHLSPRTIVFWFPLSPAVWSV